MLGLLWPAIDDVAEAQGFDALTSRVKRDAAVMEMQRLYSVKVQAVVLPLLESLITNALGSVSSGPWLHYELDADAKSPIIHFRYPSTQNRDFAYVRREVKLELGALTDQQPTGHYPIRPPPARFGHTCPVCTTLFRHGVFVGTPRCIRVFDRSGAVRAGGGLEKPGVCRGWARYDLAQPGSFRLVPPRARQAELAWDYATMRPMLMTKPPSFETLMTALAEAEKQLRFALQGGPKPPARTTAAPSSASNLSHKAVLYPAGI